jgi:DDE family transposase
MADATGEAKEPRLRVAFDRRIKLEFQGARITSDGGLLAYRELDGALGLTDMAITKLLDGRRGQNTRHKLSGLFRQAGDDHTVQGEGGPGLRALRRGLLWHEG